MGVVLTAILYLHGREVDSVFQLLGEHENDMTYSLAWALSHSPSFLRTFLHKLVRTEEDMSRVLIRLQEYERQGKRHGGFTDIEIELPGKLYLIVEAKRGWTLPRRVQLQKYGSRFKRNKARFKRLVVLSECSRYYTEIHLETWEVAGVPIEPISWDDIVALAREAYLEGSHSEKRLIQQLLDYLGGIVTMQDRYSNMVYVVALALGTPRNWDISWIDIVKKRRRYFHPVGVSGWPKEPPNYIAFRYYGKLQSIHHIEGYEVATNMHSRIRQIPSEEWEPHFLYKLGLPFRPSKEVPTGRIYPNGRVWCMLDTLFTYDTISEARDHTKERERLSE